MNSCSIPIALNLVSRAVRREQVDPGEHPHQVVDPEREDQQEQHQPLPASGVPGREVRDGVADQEQRRTSAIATNTNVRRKTVRNWPPCQMFSQRLEHVADVPVERIPERNRLRERVLVAECDADDGVQRDEEEEREPGDPGKREQPPGPARPHV